MPELKQLINHFYACPERLSAGRSKSPGQPSLYQHCLSCGEAALIAVLVDFQKTFRAQLAGWPDRIRYYFKRREVHCDVSLRRLCRRRGSRRADLIKVASTEAIVLIESALQVAIKRHP